MITRKFTHSTRALAFGASALALTVSAPAFAQDADKTTAATGNQIAEIVVTAQFREQRLQDTPLAITAVDSALLEARSQDDIEAVAKQAPSVTLQEQGGAYGASMGASIRGIGQFDFNPAYEPGVGMYIDDVYYPTLTGANFDLLDLERVEVLRGPQGTLTGRNSIGGAIKLFSKKPSNESSAFAEASYGSRDRLELRAGMNIPITSNLYARVSGVHKEQDGYVDQIDYGCANPNNTDGVDGAPILPTIGSDGTGETCKLADLGNTNYSGLRGALRWEASPDVDLMVIADYQNSDRYSAGEVQLVGPSQFDCGKYCTYANWFLPAAGQAGAYYTSNRNKFSGWGVSGHADINLGAGLQLQSITAYREYNNKWGTDDDFSPDPKIAAGGINDLDFWFFSQELRLNGSIGENIDFTLGGFYSDQRSTYFTQQDIRYIIPGAAVQFIGNDPVNADSKAAFGTVIFKPTYGMTITGGIRYTEEHKDYTFVRRNFQYEKAPILLDIDKLDGLTSVYDGDRVDWRVSVDYRFSPAVLAYATVSTGFKGGGVTARPFLPQHAEEGDFGPETVTSYEAGLKTNLFDRRVQLNLAAFYNDYKDIQLPLSDCSAYGGNPCAVVANAGDGKIYGFEAELNAEPIDGLMIDGSLSLLGSEYTYIAPAVGNSVQDDDPIVSPEVQFSAGIQYEIGLGDSGSVTPRFDLSYRGKDFRGHALDVVSDEYQYIDAYALANGRLTYRNADRDLSVSLEVLNIFDKYYMPARFDAVYGFTGTAYALVGRPREWRVSLRKDF
ncbi:TonB-dependent receptor [Altericroceibacterium endophyticum]|uniref:TonB-dependent receptor n=1 Tax=Altericroceibacterium endophyticum TaxID=1808508 RepID=A0A6I4T386_9SPHN|nr:TonB-dependent receptor [Altericroceibacterium endophyticum]MXO65387.1 TonB-dependent receptor [Altericroceibacterium endophyticum]